MFVPMFVHFLLTHSVEDIPCMDHECIMHVGHVCLMSWSFMWVMYVSCHGSSCGSCMFHAMLVHAGLGCIKHWLYYGSRMSHRKEIYSTQVIQIFKQFLHYLIMAEYSHIMEIESH